MGLAEKNLHPPLKKVLQSEAKINKHVENYQKYIKYIKIGH